MAFKTWQIGLHIQQHEALAIAVIRGASGWSLQRWWRLPLMNASTAEGTILDPQSLAHVLRPWSRELPLRHRIYLSFPANRTLQRAFPHPPMRLREREQVAWLSQTMARELDMDPDLLRFDFQDDALSPAFNVTAVQSKEISALLTLAQTLNVRIAAVTPDACALQRLLPFIPSGRQCLVWRDEIQWLWATRYAWGRKSAREATTLHDLAATYFVMRRRRIRPMARRYRPPTAGSAGRLSLCDCAGVSHRGDTLMAHSVNLLPWRRQHYVARLRLWCVVWGASLLLIASLATIARLVFWQEGRINELLLTAENGRTTALAANIPQLQQRQRQQQARLQRQAQRELTQAWQSILTDLANLLPDQAWLTSLNYQQETLELEGLARTFDALLTLETSLRHYVSFPLNRTGATRQDAQGRWQFHYQLTRSAARERAL